MDDARRQRADAGQVRATARDALALSWVVEMYGMPLDLLRQLTGGMSDSAMRNMISRWRRAGWVESGQVGAGPSWVWATKAGVESFGRYPYEAHRPSAAKIGHHRGVIAARIALEAKRAGDDPAWVSERQLRYELGQRRGADAQREHMLDGIFHWDRQDGGRASAGVEVELSPKPFAQLRSNMTAGLGQITPVIWFVTARTRALVERVVEDIQPGNKVSIRELPEGGVIDV